jgi:hypothetical protein
MSAPASNRTLGELADEYGRTDRLTDPHEPAEPVVENIAAESSNGDNLELQACPCCPREFADERDVRQHLEAVDPEHFGLGGGYVPYDPLTPEEIPGGGQ